MYAYELCRKYQEALNRKDQEAILDLFTNDASVKAPLLGELDVMTFHQRVFESCGYAVTKLTNVFDGLHHARSVALQFVYTWTFPGGRQVSVEGMSVFELDETRKKFGRLTIIYDPTEFRRNLKGASAEMRMAMDRRQEQFRLAA
ncbi:nuclear transport factor 2 family protein [Noviherbaspirillum sp. ST9]|uniref:nuclear transport factor 2 family protein n=1 Tax=Noviherbaspirillum sp. ST9 TaxID=3401606 RepID=UPI003B58A4F9